LWTRFFPELAGMDRLPQPAKGTDGGVL